MFLSLHPYTGATAEVVLQIIDMDYNQDSHQIGNTMAGLARFSHYYEPGKAVQVDIRLTLG